MNSLTKKGKAKIDTQNQFNLIPSVILVTTRFGEVLFLNSYAIKLLNLPNYRNYHIKDLLTNGSGIFFETYLLSCFKEDNIKDEVFLTLKKETEKIPVVFNINLNSDNELIFSGVTLKNRIEKEKKLKESFEKSESHHYTKDDYESLKEELELNQLKLEKQLKNLSRINNEYVQLNKVLAHDLQEPIRKISYLSDRLINSPDSLAKIYKERILGLAENSQKLLKSVHRYFSLEKPKISKWPFSIETLIENVITNNFVDPVNVTVTNEDKHLISGDFMQIGLLFQELIKNSIQFNNQSVTNIELELDVIEKNYFVESNHLYEYRDFIRIKYWDNSIGFEEKHEQKVFDLFQKLTNSDNLGLGLSYCKKIAEVHGGSIKAEFTTPNQPVFVIMLPK